MVNKFIIEKFEEFISSSYQTINEAEGIKIGFVAILGSTDAENLGSVVAPKIGIKPDTIYTLTINGEKDLLTLGKNETYQGFAGIKESGKSKPQEDYISIKSGESTGEIKAGVKSKGNFMTNFDKSSSIEVKASNNGLLAFLRACKSMSKAAEGKESFSDKGWTGKILISMGNPPSKDDSRNSAFLAVNPNVNGSNPARFTGFEDTINRFNRKETIIKVINESSSYDRFEPILEEEGKTDSKAENIKVIGDTIADAIRAAHYYNSGGTIPINDFGAYNGFREAYKKYRESVGKEEWKKANSTRKSSFILAVLLQSIFNDISASYPMDWKNVDLLGGCKEILSALGKDTKVNNLGSARETLKKMLEPYKPTKYKIAVFDPVLGEFWDALSNAIVSRSSITFGNNVDAPSKALKGGPKAETEGNEKSGVKKNVSGGV